MGNLHKIKDENLSAVVMLSEPIFFTRTKSDMPKFCHRYIEKTSVMDQNNRSFCWNRANMSTKTWWGPVPMALFPFKYHCPFQRVAKRRQGNIYYYRHEKLKLLCIRNSYFYSEGKEKYLQIRVHLNAIS